MQNMQKENELATGNVRQLMTKFAVPSIISMMVSAVYNIVDQLFIGNAVGTLGNAATNVVFPLAILCTSLALLFGIGGASSFNLKMGAGKREEAPYYVGNAIAMMAGLGFVLFLLMELFLTSMLQGFGSPADVLPLAQQYVRIVAIGVPFMILTIGGSHLIRADGNPKMAMLCNASGAVLNIGLDALFVLVFGWGMSGAALATIIGQIFSAFLTFRCLVRFKTVQLEKKHFRPQGVYLKQLVSLGVASCVNQIAMMVVQIAMNNLLKHYGALSTYGESIPIACAGIVMKVNQLYFAIIIGLAQGSQPIESFNYGARQYRRVKAAYRCAILTGGAVSIVAFLAFQLFPAQILGLFGNGSAEYFAFGTSYFRIFLFFTWLNCMQPVTSTFFTSIGKAYKGTFLSLTRQILFLLPLIFILPMRMGIHGILFAAPIADFLAFTVALGMVVHEWKNMNRLEAAQALS